MNNKEKNLATDLDQTDHHIIRLLSENGKMANKQLAEQVGLSVSPTFERVKRLERLGVIRGYRAEINRKLLGIGLRVFCYVTLKAHDRESIDDFEHAVVNLEEVVHCNHLAGQYDYSLFIEVVDIEAYQAFLKQKLAGIPGIANVQSSFVLSSIK